VSTTEQEEATVQILSRVFEEFAFLFPVAVPKKELGEPPARSIEAKITFSGPHTGSLCMVLPRSVCTEVAANVLGTDPDDHMAQDRQQDAVRELLNIVCGQFLTQLYDDRMIFDLAPPSSRDLDALGWNAHATDPRTLAFSMIEGPLLFRFDISEEAG
jgi:chemotaxis protein CheY-P-specific phosphatase CheC